MADGRWLGQTYLHVEARFQLMYIRPEKTKQGSRPLGEDDLHSYTWRYSTLGADCPFFLFCIPIPTINSRMIPYWQQPCIVSDTPVNPTQIPDPASMYSSVHSIRPRDTFSLRQQSETTSQQAGPGSSECTWFKDQLQPHARSTKPNKTQS